MSGNPKLDRSSCSCSVEYTLRARNAVKCNTSALMVKSALYRLCLRAAREHDRRPVLKTLLSARRARVFADGQWVPVSSGDTAVEASAVEFGELDAVDKRIELYAHRLFHDGVFYRPSSPPVSVQQLVRDAWRDLDGDTANQHDSVANTMEQFNLDVALAGLRILENNAGLGEKVLGSLDHTTRVVSASCTLSPELAQGAQAHAATPSLNVVTRLATKPAARTLHGAGERWLRGKLLVAQPLLSVVPPHAEPSDAQGQNGPPNIPATYRTVVLVCHTDQNGSLGLCLNCPAGFTLRDLLHGAHNSDTTAAETEHQSTGLTHPVLKRFLDHDVLVGGPVAPQSLLLLHCSTARMHFGETTVAGNIRFTSDLDGVQKAIESGLATADEYRLFMGYAGWAPTQLEGECDLNTWLVAEGDEAAETLVRAPVTRDLRAEMWSEVLRHMGGEHAEFAQLASRGGFMEPDVREELLTRSLGLGLCCNLNTIDLTPPDPEQEPVEADDMI